LGAEYSSAPVREETGQKWVCISRSCTETKQGPDNPAASGMILFSEVFLSKGPLPWPVAVGPEAGDRIPSADAAACWTAAPFVLVLAREVAAAGSAEQRRQPAATRDAV